jgi:hypothetical protein
MARKKFLPFPVGTVLRCTRETELGTDMVHGRVIEWHNDEGWLVESPNGGIIAGPGTEAFLGRAPSALEWSFQVVRLTVKS